MPRPSPVTDAIVRVLCAAPPAGFTCAEIADQLPPLLGQSAETVRSALNALERNGRVRRIAPARPSGRWSATKWTAAS